MFRQSVTQAIWRRRAFCRLGTGDVPIDAVLEALRAASYGGWLIVEQDIIPDAGDVAGVRPPATNRRIAPISPPAACS
jgi:inosose dehydratase